MLMKYITEEDAVSDILSKVEILKKGAPDYDTSIAQFYAGKFVADVMDYCHRTDFPDTLSYAAADLIIKWLGEDKAGASGPLKSLKQNDTEFTFAVSDVSGTGSAHDADFEALKPKLNRYRRMGGRPPCATMA